MVFFADAELLNLKVMSGELDYASRNLTLSNYPVYKRSEQSGGYRAFLVKKPLGSNLGFAFNPTHKDPVLRAIFNDIRFKQAMSIAFDRDQINENFFFGEAVPRQALMPSTGSLYEDWMGNYFIQYDPDKANQLLDEMGLQWDSGHQVRLRPDGKPLAFTMSTTPVGVAPEVEILELISEQWAKVGVKVDVKLIERGLFTQRGNANEHDAAAFQFGGNGNEVRMITTGGFLYSPPWGVLKVGVPWYNWYLSGGKEGEEPPETIKHLYETIDKWKTTLQGTERYNQLGKEILKIHVENLYYIGTVGEVPSPAIFRNGLLNTPQEGAVWVVTFNFSAPHLPETWFWE